MKKKLKRLDLNVETLRRLDDLGASQVVGGITGTLPCSECSRPCTGCTDNCSVCIICP